MFSERAVGRCRCEAYRYRKWLSCHAWRAKGDKTVVRCDTRNKIPAVVRNRKGGLEYARRTRAQEGWVAMLKRRARGERKMSSDVFAGVDQDRPFPRFPLTDEQWREVAKRSGIPEGVNEARHNIETTVGIFRQFQASDLDEVPSAKIREEFEALADAARNLHDRLSKLIEVRDAYEALAGEPSVYNPLDRLSDFVGSHQSENMSSPVEGMTRVDGQRRVSEALDVLLRLPKWLLVAAHRLKAANPGPPAGNEYWLVGSLDGIREQFAGKKITRSYKDDASKKYITYVCKIADPNIGAGTIDKAMKDRVNRRRRRVD